MLITANDSYYPTNHVPEFWSWIQHQGRAGNVKIPLEIWEEITPGRKKGDSFLEWISDDENSAALVLDEEVDSGALQIVVSKGYSDNLNELELEVVGRDPFLIAYAFADAAGRCVVTAEASKPSKQRQNRHIPDVCDTLHVKWCDPFALNRSLGFSTGWKP